MVRVQKTTAKQTAAAPDSVLHLTGVTFQSVMLNSFLRVIAYYLLHVDLFVSWRLLSLGMVCLALIVSSCFIRDEHAINFLASEINFMHAANWASLLVCHEVLERFVST
jgi:hypothetical protein